MSKLADKYDLRDWKMDGREFGAEFMAWCHDVAEAQDFPVYVYPNEKKPKRWVRKRFPEPRYRILRVYDLQT